MIRFGTKAETLELLAPILRSASVLPQARLTVAQWRDSPNGVLDRIGATGLRQPLIVRSSALSEDGRAGSLAGHFVSVPDVEGRDALRRAIDTVVASFGRRDEPRDQVFVQPMLLEVRCSGVAFSVDPNTNGPYLVVNYDDTTRSTDSVTKGHSNQLKTFYAYRLAEAALPGDLERIAALMRELEQLLGTEALDVEFAIAGDGKLHLLQVRPLAIRPDAPLDAAAHRRALDHIHRKLREMSRPHPYLHGSRSVYGIMPDWNPAEMIGVRPRPLALSLYKEIITDNIWAYQRDNYGYKNLRSFPLMLSFCGLPYIDVRVDFNSFVPKELAPEFSEKLVNYYVDRLIETPSHHDKVEFEVVFSCYTLDFQDRARSLRKNGFSEEECGRLGDSLRALTNRIIHGETGLWRQDMDRIKHLNEGFARIRDSELDTVGKIYWILEDCKRYGTLPFAGLARAAFIAVQLLKSLISVGILSEDEYDSFLASLDTVSSRMGRDFRSLSRGEFLSLYGHLRPGTYDILSPRYDEAPERYFDWSKRGATANGGGARHSEFRLTPRQREMTESLLKTHRLDHDVPGLFDFIRQAIEGREYAKFVFTRSLSEALKLFQLLGRENGLSAEDCSFADINCIRELHASTGDAGETLRAHIAHGRRRYELTQQIVLPPLITKPEDLWAFHLPASEPNFVTQKRVSGPIAVALEDHAALKSRILLIPNADPGHDWIFAHGIAGLITMYGGVNSHMAIRAGELGIPAVIGAGEQLYNQWSAARLLELDCANRQVRVLS